MTTQNILQVVGIADQINDKSKPASPVTGPDRDRELAQKMVVLVRELNMAMEEAVKSGLLVEPNLAKASSRFGDLGMAESTHILNVKVFRKLC